VISVGVLPFWADSGGEQSSCLLGKRRVIRKRGKTGLGAAHDHLCRQPSRPSLQAWRNTVSPSPSMCSLNRMSDPALARIISSVALRPSREPRCFWNYLSSRKPKVERLELGGRISHPECQDRALDVEALREQHLGLPIER
jgi:hypothetical protein